MDVAVGLLADQQVLVGAAQVEHGLVVFGRHGGGAFELRLGGCPVFGAERAPGTAAERAHVPEMNGGPARGGKHAAARRKSKPVDAGAASTRIIEALDLAPGVDVEQDNRAELTVAADGEHLSVRREASRLDDSGGLP